VSSLLPSAEQTLLLRAALGEGDEVEQAWRAWKAACVLDDADGSSIRLLPLVYLNLVEHGIDDPELPRLKGVSRHVWAANQIRFRQLAEVLEMFAAAGIDTAVIRGVALVMRVYPGLGARPMDDADVLVRSAARDAAYRLLRHAGWVAAPYLGPVPDSRVPHMSGVNMLGPKGGDLDLHWNPLPYAPGNDEEFWRRAEPAELRGRRTHLLSPTHELLLSLFHGAKWRSAPPIRWVADSVLLLRAFEIDWDELCAQAVKRYESLVAAHGLRYLRDAFAAPVPDSVVTRLEHAGVPRFARVAFERRRAQTAPAQGLAFHRSHYARLSGPWPAWRRLARLPGYLRDWWGLRSVLQVPGEAIRRTRQVDREV
jgi:hypothetical protein